MRVATEEELDALPVGTVVLSDEVKHHEGGWAIAYQRWQDGDWHRGARSGSTHPDNFLPVTVLHLGPTPEPFAEWNSAQLALADLASRIRTP